MADEQSRTPAEDMAQGKSWDEMKQKKWDDLQEPQIKLTMPGAADREPELDPDSPQFNPQLYADATAKANEEMQQSLDEFKKLLVTIAENLASDEFQQTANTVANAINNVLAKVTAFTNLSNGLSREQAQNLFEGLVMLVESGAAIDRWLKEFGPLQPYIKAELDKPEYAGITIYDLIDYGRRDTEGNQLDADGQPTADGLLEKAIANARIAYSRDHDNIEVVQADTLEYPLDKVSGYIWNLFKKDTKGQITFGMESKADKKKGRNLDLVYSINFDALGDDVTITKSLLPFDKRVYMAVSALFNAGNETMSLSQIYYTMGYSGNPGTKDLLRIDKSITKMRGAIIYIDNEGEAAVYNYDHFRYDGSLLPFKRVSAILDNKVVDAAIRVLDEPPVITFAKNRKQITKISVRMLQSPINKTEANLQLEDYLIDRIAKAKNGTGQPRILYKTVYEHIGLASETPTNQKNIKKRTPNKIKKYLDHYKKCGWISRYTTDKDGVTVYFK